MLREIKTSTRHYFEDVAGLIQGESFEYYDNGKLWVHAFFMDGERHGEYKSYYDNGNPLVHTVCKNGYRHGRYTRFEKNGDIELHTFFYFGENLHINPDTLTEKDILFIMMTGRLPQKEQTC